MSDPAAVERQRIIQYLMAKGILRSAMFADGLVGCMVETQAEDVWPIIDLPADLGANQTKEESNQCAPVT